MPKYDEFDDPGRGVFSKVRDAFDKRESFGARKPVFAFAIAGSLIVLLAAVVWASYPHGRGGDAGAVPVIHAEVGPVKTAPDAEGGMEIPNRESTVFNAVRGRNPDGHVENLLPETEQPIDRNQVFGAAPAADDKTPVTSASKTVDDKTEASDVKATLMQLADAAPGAGAPQATESVQLGNAPGFTPQPTPSTQSAAPASVADHIADKPAASVAPRAQQDLPTGAVTTAPHSSKAPTVNAPSALPSTGSAPRSGGTAPVTPPSGQSSAKVPDTDDADATDNVTGSPSALAPQSGDATDTVKPATSAGTRYVQLAALADRDAADATWKRLQLQYPDQFKSTNYRIVTAQVKGHTYYRVQAGPMSRDQAASACKAVNAKKPGACLAVAG